MKLGEQIQSADWKSEKHVPVIECQDQIEPGKPFLVTVSVGREIPHPNTTEHHIRWIDVYFQPEDKKFIHQVGRFEFTSHGESVEGADQGPLYVHPMTSFSLLSHSAGTLIALSYCNIHGLWQGSKEVKTAE